MSIFVPPQTAVGAGDEPSQAVPLNLPTTSGEVSGLTSSMVPGELLGYSVRETSGSAGATIILYDNKTAASGTILKEISIAQGTAVALLGTRGQGVQINNGVYASITGAIQGDVYV